MILAVHPAYVLDASVVAKWFTLHGEADRETALALRERHRTRRCRLAIPEFGLLEVANAIRCSGAANETIVATALEALAEMELRVEALDRALLRSANAIAWRYGVTAYDAAYVALGERDGFPLITPDDALVRKMRGHAVVVRLGALTLPDAGG